LTKWNRTVNLTALSLEPLSDQALDRLLLEPLLAAREATSTDRSLVDIGSGGGSPAIPLKIAAPWLRLVMIESRARKSAFLREVVRELGWQDATVETARLEALAASADPPQADLVSLRAVRADERLWAQVSQLLAPSGRVLWFVGPGELSHSATGFRVAATRELGAPGAGLVVLERDG